MKFSHPKRTRIPKTAVHNILLLNHTIQISYTLKKQAQIYRLMAINSEITKAFNKPNTDQSHIPISLS